MDLSEVLDFPSGSLRTISGKSIDASQWATPDEGALEADRRPLYLARKQAALLFLAGAPAEAIRKETSVSAKHTYRLIRERCLEIHPDGRPFGWRGLVPWSRVEPYRRHKKVEIDQFGRGGAGALQMILNAHPTLRKAFNTRITTVGSRKLLVEIRRSRKSHWAWFLDELRSLGHEARGEWPFNTVSRGYSSIVRYVDSVLKANPRALADSTGGPDLVAKLKTGDGTRRPVLKFMQRVEMDAHKLDGCFCVSLPLMDGSTKEKIVHRLWVIVLIEVVSRAVIGRYFSLNKEVSQDDVLRAIKVALSPYSHRKVSFGEKAYRPQAGLLSSLGREFVGLCWDETSVDGSLAETCGSVRDALRDTVGSTLLDPETSFSKRRSKDDRPYIEAFFDTLSGRGFQRLSNTTGAKPQDRRGRAPEDVALAGRFQYEYAEELCDVLIANYNVTPHSGIGRRTPLDYAKFLSQQSGQTFRRADPALVDALCSVRKRCIVRGGATKGRAPFVTFNYATYTNEILHDRHDLVGSSIWVTCHKEDDCRVALASTLNGMSLGVLRAGPPWHKSPHSLAVRRAICQAQSSGKFIIPPGGDGVEVFTEYVESHAHNRLPVHPAYLQVRRILAAAAEQLVGSQLLETAIARADADNGCLKTDGKRRPKNKKAEGHSDSETKSGTALSAPGLPRRRMARSQ